MTTKLETITTPEIQEGDVIQTHGGRFLIVKRFERDGVIWTETKFLGDVEGQHNAIRDAFPGELTSAKGWNIQGNKLARWLREVK